MANAIRIRGLSGDVSSVSIQSSVHKTWGLLGKKWAGLRYRTHEVFLARDELVVLKCHGGSAVLSIEATRNDHGETIAHGDCPTLRLRTDRRSERILLRQGQAVCLKTTDAQYPWKVRGPIIEV